MIDLEYHHVAATTKLMDMGTDHQQLLISQKERWLDIMCLLDESTYYYLTSTSNLQVIQRTEEYVKHHGLTIGTIQALESTIGQTTWFLNFLNK